MAINLLVRGEGRVSELFIWTTSARMITLHDWREEKIVYLSYPPYNRGITFSILARPALAAVLSKQNLSPRIKEWVTDLEKRA
jgi:hypothetical protein